jgi:hypothetical protein
VESSYQHTTLRDLFGHAAFALRGPPRRELVAGATAIDAVAATTAGNTASRRRITTEVAGWVATTTAGDFDTYADVIRVAARIVIITVLDGLLGYGSGIIDLNGRAATADQGA